VRTLLVAVRVRVAPPVIRRAPYGVYRMDRMGLTGVIRWGSPCTQQQDSARASHSNAPALTWCCGLPWLQAPGSSEEEREYAWRKFGFEFDVFDKIDVNGSNAHPLYKFMRARQPVSVPGKAGATVGGPGSIEWNYVKFLVDRNGQPIKRYKVRANTLVAVRMHHTAMRPP
jgi:hypothetical protein